MLFTKAGITTVGTTLKCTSVGLVLLKFCCLYCLHHQSQQSIWSKFNHRSLSLSFLSINHCVYTSTLTLSYREPLQGMSPYNTLLLPLTDDLTAWFSCMVGVGTTCWHLDGIWHEHVQREGGFGCMVHLHYSLDPPSTDSFPTVLHVMEWWVWWYVLYTTPAPTLNFLTASHALQCSFFTPSYISFNILASVYTQALSLYLPHIFFLLITYV